MKATLVHALMDPRRIDDAARAVEDELAPGFLSHPGARHGYWMAHRRSGRVMTVTVWNDSAGLSAASAAEGARRAVVGDRIGARIVAVRTMDVVGSHEECIDRAPRIRWVRATWVEGVRSSRRGVLPDLYREAVPDQARTRGFCASYWLADPTVGTGLGLSFWEGPAEVRNGESASGRRRRRFEEVLGCRVAAVREFEALGVASVVPAGAGVTAPDGPTRSTGVPLAELGTSLHRPPGTLLAVSGDRTDQVVVVLGGHAAVVHGAGLEHLGSGDHFGGHGILERRSHPHTVMATTPVHLGVISRSEFAELSHSTPEVARELVDHDATS